MEPIVGIDHKLAEVHDINIVIEDSCNCCCCFPIKTPPNSPTNKVEEVSKRTFFGLNFQFFRTRKS